MKTPEQLAEAIILQAADHRRRDYPRHAVAVHDRQRWSAYLKQVAIEVLSAEIRGADTKTHYHAQHQMLEELCAGCTAATGKHPSQTSVAELLAWSSDRVAASVTSPELTTRR